MGPWALILSVMAYGTKPVCLAIRFELLCHFKAFCSKVIWHCWDVILNDTVTFQSMH